MGVSEQAAYAASLVHGELLERIDELHAELHELSTRMDRDVSELKSALDGLSSQVKPTRSRSASA